MRARALGRPRRRGERADRGARRHAFKHIVERSGVLTTILGRAGPGAVMNMDNLLLRESMDVIGRVGFEKEMGSLEDFMEGDVGSGASVDVMLRCTHEARPPPRAPWALPLPAGRRGPRLAVVHALSAHPVRGVPRMPPARVARSAVRASCSAHMTACRYRRRS
jgi:hypothetical protein